MDAVILGGNAPKDFVQAVGGGTQRANGNVAHQQVADDVPAVPLEVEVKLFCQKGLPPISRTLLLTVARPKATDLPMARRLVRREASRWFPERVPEDATEILKEGDWTRWFYPLLYEETAVCSVEGKEDTWETYSILLALCMRGETEAVERWLRFCPEEIMNTDSMVLHNGQIRMVVTPLCAAALAGQTDTVRLLLECGAAAAEEQYGRPSAIWSPWEPEGESRIMSITPLTAALMGGHWDTAQFLLNYGTAEENT